MGKLYQFNKKHCITRLTQIIDRIFSLNPKRSLSSDSRTNYKITKNWKPYTQYVFKYPDMDFVEIFIPLCL